MELEYKLTRQQAEEEMRQYRKIFTVVRLLKADEIGRMIEEPEHHAVDELCRCYSFWGKTQPCENCISAVAFQEKKQKCKWEFLDDHIYQVISRYVEIDGVPQVMELVRELDEDTLIDADGREKLVGKMVQYDDKLYRDALTGAYNRRYFEDRVKNMPMKAGIAVVDLDDFKLCNDTYGHDAGDVALQTLVRTIRKYIRKSDLIIRYGGDEFLLVLPDVDEDTFVQKLQQIQTKIHTVHISQYGQMPLSISVGGVIMGDESVEDAVCRADKLMYQAKTQKNMVVTEEDAIDGEHRIERSKIKQQLLIVDDSEINREILTEILKDDYRILQAENGEEGIRILQEHENDIALVLLDILMPGLNGFDVLNLMNINHWIEDIPVIIISAENSGDYVRKAYELGASDYVNCPFDSKTVYQRVYNIIKLYAKQKRLLSLVKDQIYENEKNNQMMISILSHIVEFRNGESGKHVLHINILTGLLLDKLTQKSDKYFISGNEQYLITTASALHDIGKIGIDEKILNKPGKLTAEEFEIMKQHTVIGEEMLKNLEFYQDEELVRYAREICRWHHERYDGRGYPDGLVGDEIPIAAQVVSMADVYDALTSERVYKKAFSHEKAMEMILNGECGTFNPLLLECLQEIVGEIGFSLDIADQ
mgnify:FL=1